MSPIFAFVVGLIAGAALGVMAVAMVSINRCEKDDAS